VGSSKGPDPTPDPDATAISKFHASPCPRVPCGSSCPVDKSRLTSSYCQEDAIVGCDGYCAAVIKRCPSAAACVTWDATLENAPPAGLQGPLPPRSILAATCAESKADCPTIAKAYDLEVQRLQLTVVPSGARALAPGPYQYCGGVEAHCTVSKGHCEKGLGSACHFLGNPTPHLEELAQLWHDLGCEVKTSCRCPAPPAGVRCETNPNGPGWRIGGSTSTYACIVR
jgi:hypothetical protein